MSSLVCGRSSTDSRSDMNRSSVSLKFATLAMVALSAADVTGAKWDGRDDVATWRVPEAVKPRRAVLTKSNPGTKLNTVPAASPTNNPAAATAAVQRVVRRVTDGRNLG